MARTTASGANHAAIAASSSGREKNRYKATSCSLYVGKHSGIGLQQAHLSSQQAAAGTRRHLPSSTIAASAHRR